MRAADLLRIAPISFILSVAFGLTLAFAPAINAAAQTSPTNQTTPAKKAFVGGLMTETHTGSPFFTSKEDFEPVNWAVQGYTNAANARGWRVEAGSFLFAAPANRVLRPAYEELKAQLLSQLKAAMPVDMVVLNLHGAMMVQDMPENAEGDILKSVRKIVGSNTPIGAALDPHAHLTQDMLDYADILVFFHEWPHVDAPQTALRAFNLTADVAEGKLDPHKAVFDPRMIYMYQTLEEPMRSFVRDMRAAEEDEDVAVVNLVHGFPYGDAPDMGTKMLVITNNNPEKGARLAEEFGKRIFALRGKTAAATLEFEAGLDAVEASRNHPTIIADYADTIFGGAPGDATFLLKSLMDRGLDDFIIAGLWDPMAISILENASPGARTQLRIGGKTGPMSGDPLDLEVEVRKVLKNQFLNGYEEFSTDQNGFSAGTIAVVRHKNIDIVLIEKRYPIYGHKILKALDLKPEDRRAIVVKSAGNFYDGYTDIASEFVYMLSPGLMGPVGSYDYKVFDRKIWPMNDITLQD